MSTNKEIAKTIIRQMGANEFALMTGAKNFVAVENGLSFKFAGGKCCRIILNGRDLYDIKVFRVRLNKKTFEVIQTDLGEETDIYFDQLQPAFTRLTGLDTSMGLRRKGAA